MNYQAPEMEVVAVTADAAVANDVEIEESFGGMISQPIKP